ncbi:hypothetical protein HTQ63_20915, partial [Yersinia pestis subsp. pestis]|uniref:hypothetical protein n=1 Tax=Yersinia pestis TaxID=632 RepID=UPI0018DDF83C
FALFDNEGFLVVWNPQYPLLLGLAPEQLQHGQHYLQLLKQMTPLQETTIIVDLIRDWDVTHNPTGFLKPSCRIANIVIFP